MNSSEDEVSTPNKPKGKAKSVEIEDDGSVKRSLIDEFSSTTKDMKMDAVVKIEK